MRTKHIQCIDNYLTKMTYRYLYGNVIHYDKTIQYLREREREIEREKERKREEKKIKKIK